MPSPAVILGSPVYGLPRSRSQLSGATIIPSMAAPAAAALGWSVADSAHYSAATTAPYAFVNANHSVNGFLSPSSFPVALTITAPAAFVVTEYQMLPWWVDNYPSRNVRSWQLQGSNDGGAAWYAIDNQVLNSWWQGGTVIVRFPIARERQLPFTSWRMYITANNGDGYTGIGWLNMSGYRF